MWAIEHYDVLPDMLVVRKNLSGGIAPCAGIAAKDEILGDCPEFHSGSTFAGTPAGCAAGLKTLEIFERDGVVEDAEKLGNIAAEVMRRWERFESCAKRGRAGCCSASASGVPSRAKRTGGTHEPCAAGC